MSPTLPPALLAKLSSTCRWRGCDRVKADSEYCAEHHEKQRGYEAKSQRGRRAARAKAGECRDCGLRLPPRWHSGRCRDCQQKQADDAKARRVKDSARRVKDTRRVARAPKGHYKTEVFADGASRTRFVGQSHRGGPTRAEQDASLLRLLVDARRLHEGFLAAFPSSREVIDALPRIQRTEAWELLASQLTRSARLQLDVAGALAVTWRETCAGCGRAHEKDDAD